MSRIGYRHRLYQVTNLASAQFAESFSSSGKRTASEESNEQRPPPETPDSANSLSSSSKAPPPPHRDTQNSEMLLTLIDSELWRNGQPSWEGGAEELQRELTKDRSACAREARRLLNWNGATARYLGRLWRAHPERVERLSHQDARRWRIRPPDTVDT